MTLVFCLEEPSARAMLEGVLPRLLPDGVEVRFIVFDGKQDLHKQLTKRIRGWLLPQSKFVVLRDQDSGDCLKIKGELQALCQDTGKSDVLIRIACHELESFYLGDLSAVEKGLGIEGLARQQTNSKFRVPDRLNNAAQELSRITRTRYQKLSGSRAIGPHLSLDGQNRSASFKTLVSGIERLCEVME